MLAAFLLGLLAAPAAQHGASARVEVLEGRASLAGSEGVRVLRPVNRAVAHHGRAYLELPALSRVSIRWHATASLLLRGPAALEWGPGEGGRALEWHLISQTDTHLEIRRGPVRATLPGGWTATFESGAAYLRGTSGGGLELHHDAGLPVLLVAPHEPSRARPPRVVLAGARLRLEPRRLVPSLLPGSEAQVLEPYGRPEELALGHGSSATPWAGFSWPWRVRAVEARVVTSQLPPPLQPAPPQPEPRTEAPGELDRGAPVLTPESWRWLLVPPLFPAAPREAAPEPAPATSEPLPPAPGGPEAPSIRRTGDLKQSPYGATWEDPGL